MKRDSAPRTCTCSEASWAASAVALSCAVLAAPAQAQDGPQIDIYGYVAPRCWVASQPAAQPIADTALPRPRVICNQAAPALQSNVRALNADGTLAERIRQSGPDQLTARAALEIIVSPQL